MNRMRVMLGSLLPALLLAATAQGYLFDPSGEAGGDGRNRSALAASSDKRVPVQGGCNCGLSGRGWSRRAWQHSGPDGYLAGGGQAQPAIVAPGGAAVLYFPDSGELARTWQFLWRTAPEPRAPSAIS